MELKFTLILSPLFVAILGLAAADACRLNSELLKGYARKTIEDVLTPDQFGSVYWPNEPLPVHSLSKAFGMNITLAEALFDVGPAADGTEYEKQRNEIDGDAKIEPPRHNGSTDLRASLIQDIFVTCSIDRDRSYALSINLELENPFKAVDVYYESLGLFAKKLEQGEESQGDRGGKGGSFRINLPQSSLLVRLNQRIRYDDCLSVNYVQLSPTVNYLIDCDACSKSEQEFLDKIFHKRMSQLDAELDAVLSEKVRFGLQVLLSQQRLDLDTYLD